jgi:hypothetical protein
VRCIFPSPLIKVIGQNLESLHVMSAALLIVAYGAVAWFLGLWLQVIDPVQLRRSLADQSHFL